MADVDAYEQVPFVDTKDDLNMDDIVPVDEEELQAAVDAVLKEEGSYNHFSDEDYQRFDYTFELSATAGTKGTILHRLVADGDTEKTAHLAGVMTRIAAAYPQLLAASQSADMGQTPLHAAVRNKQPRMVSALIQGFEQSRADPSLIQGILSRKVESRTCLHTAIGNNLAEWAIHDMLRHATDAVLSVQDGNQRTPLHEAVRYHDCTSERLETVLKMIKISEKALCIRDRRGESAYMHHVRTRDEYKLSQHERKEAAEKDRSGAVDAETPQARIKRDGDRGYYEHQGQSESGATAGKKVDLKTAAPKERESSGNQPDRRGKADSLAQYHANYLRNREKKDEDDSNADHRIQPNQGARRNVPLEPTMGPPPRRGTGRLGGPSRSPSRTRDDDRRQKEEYDRKRREDEEKKRKAEVERQKWRRLARQQRQERIKERQRKEDEASRALRTPEILEKNSTRIKLELKLRCMRTHSAEDTSRFIYGKNSDDVLICFDFPCPPTIQLAGFEENFSHTKFDTVLQYVAFPAVRLEQTDKNEDNDGASFERDRGSGRTDMIYFFGWLRRKKNVTRIVKVIVEDAPKPPHSDAAIVEALQGLHVEELHWLKTDLDPVTISDVSKDIRELSLRWSGSNTALRAWGEPYGLRRLEHLTTVYLELVGEENLESYDRTMENVRKFEARLNSDPALENISQPPGQGRTLARRIEVRERGMDPFRRDKHSESSAYAMDMNANIKNHKWLDTIDEFAKRMRDLWKKAQSKDPSRKNLAQPVVVALIDDGVDIYDSSFRGKLYDGKTLSYSTVGNGEPLTSQREKSYFVSAGGHGTVMAHMIYRACPMVKLYIIRMETRTAVGNGGGLKGRIAPRSAAAAVEAAIEKKVNIISMSWTVTPEPDSPDGIALRSAIERAANNNILMFASSSDGGQFEENTWPVKIKRDRIFRIGAANANGSPFSWAGKPESLDYILPGVDVAKRKQQPAEGRSKTGIERADDVETGSSVATALAAGMAALLLTCFKIAAMEGSTTVTEEVVREMQKHENMKATLDTFKDLSDPIQNKFMEIWKTMDTTKWPDFVDSDSTTRMNIAAHQISHMVPQKVFLRR